MHRIRSAQDSARRVGYYAGIRRTRRQFVQTSVAGLAATFVAPSLIHAAAAGQPDAVRNQTAEGVAPPRTIDWHNHWFPARVVDILKKRTAPPRIQEGATGELTFISGLDTLRQPLPLAPAFTDVEARLRHLDKVKVDHQVISWPTTLGADALLTAEEAKPLWSAYNEDLSKLVKSHPDRFSGFAVLPTSDIPWAVVEFERSLTELGLIGATLPVGAFQTLEGAKHLTPIFEVAQKHRSHIYLHTGPASPGIPGQRQLVSTAGDAPGIRANFETANTFAQAAITLTQTGFLDLYPDVTVQIAMMGGLTPFLASWLQLRPAAPGEVDPIKLLRRVYLDASTSRSPGAIDFAVRTIGADRILFGSDFPIVTSDKVISAINGSTLTAEEKKTVFVDNGQALLAKLRA